MSVSIRVVCCPIQQPRCTTIISSWSSRIDRPPSSIARLFRPATKISVSIPAAMASSTVYWIMGLSIMNNNSFGIALVAGENAYQNQRQERLPSYHFCYLSFGVENFSVWVGCYEFTLESAVYSIPQLKWRNKAVKIRLGTLKLSRRGKLFYAN